MPSPHSDCALILVGHGSTLNPDSATPTHQHADVIRQRGVFAEVVCAFWKEEPSMREVFYALRSRTSYVVPLFISEGYFCQQVLPRELRLDGPVTRRADGTTVFYCDPVGIHPSMTKLLLKRADEVAPGVPRGETSLVIVGHGTSLNENSRKAIEQQVELIRDGGYGFAEVVDTYMEEAPFVAKWAELTTAPNVVVVPFFIADGLHSYQDIPVLLGMEAEVGAAASQREVFRHNPHELHGRKLYYSSAIGTEELMADVVMDQVKDFDAKHGVATRVESGGEKATGLDLPEGGFVIGQVRATRKASGAWLVHHRDETGDETPVQRYSVPEDARDIATYDDKGEFRPLKTAPNLRHGWQLELADDDALRAALDFLYPAALGFLTQWQQGTLEPVPLRATLGRQTGMYRFANTIQDEQAQEMVACECDAATKCLRRITWGLDASQPLTRLTEDKKPAGVAAMLEGGELPLLCVEACTHLVSAARAIAQKNYKASEAARAHGTGA